MNGLRRVPSFVTHWYTDLKRPLYGVKNRLEDRLLEFQVRFNDRIRHLHGPRDIGGGARDLIVLCLERNGALWIDSFVEHHLSLGARHIVFLDNGSTDETVERAVRHEHVSVWSTDLPFRRYENAFRRWLTRRFAWGRWGLHVDIDEQFDYPGSSGLPLDGFLAYQDAHGYRAVLAHMVDMFSDRPFDELEDAPGDDVAEKYRFYDNSELERRRDIYWIRDQGIENEGIFCAFGGVRKTVFGSRGLLQSKHPLVKTGSGTRVYPYDGHFATGAAVSDVTAALMHYKFLGVLLASARREIRRAQHTPGVRRHYGGFVRVLGENPSLSLTSETSRELESVDQLVEEGLLAAPPRYWEWVAEHGGDHEGSGERRPEEP